MTELSGKVKKWICEQGYPVEMHVAKKFREAGFRTTQSEYFVDPESGDNREIDVVVSCQRDIGELLVRVTVCVECKLSKKHPWVAFTSKDTRLAKPASIVQRPANKLGKEFLYRIAQNKYAHQTPLFKMGERNGFSLTEAFTSGKDNAYAACLSVAKCARSLVIKAEEGSRLQGPICNIVIPLVVVDGKLFECYQDELDLEVEEIGQATLIWRNQVSNAGHSIIGVCTLDALPKYIRRVSRLASFVFAQEDVFQKMEKESLAEYKHRWKHLLVTKGATGST